MANTNQSAFEAERKAFEQMKRAIESQPELKIEIEACLNALFNRFATTVRENRFIVGGVLEVLMSTVLRASEVPCTDVGITDQRFDIRLEGGGFSVKGHFQPKNGNIRLINTLGSSEQAQWDTATLFIIHNLGIGYADPELLPNATERVSDAVVIKSKRVKEFLEDNPKYLIRLEVPLPIKDSTKSEVVSRLIAKEIISKTNILKKYLTTQEEETDSR